jgi:hypothetical protein
MRPVTLASSTNALLRGPGKEEGIAIGRGRYPVRARHDSTLCRGSFASSIVIVATSCSETELDGGVRHRIRTAVDAG